MRFVAKVMRFPHVCFFHVCRAAVAALVTACFSPVVTDTVTPTQGAAPTHEKPVGLVERQQESRFNESGLIGAVEVRRGIPSDSSMPAATPTIVETKHVAWQQEANVVGFRPGGAADWGSQGAVTLLLYTLSRRWKREAKGRKPARW